MKKCCTDNTVAGAEIYLPIDACRLILGERQVSNHRLNNFIFNITVSAAFCINFSYFYSAQNKIQNTETFDLSSLK